MKRGGPLKRRTRLKPRSAKREAIAAERAALVQRVLTDRPRCEVVDGTRCLRNSEHVHEPLTRARGGSILDMKNTVAVCGPCHRRIHDNPAWATELGLLISQFSPTGAHDRRLPTHTPRPGVDAPVGEASTRRFCRCGEKYEDHSRADVKACLARYGLQPYPSQGHATNEEA